MLERKRVYFISISLIHLALRLLIQQSKPIPKSRGNQSTLQKKKKKKKKKKNRSAFMDKHTCPQKEPHILSLKAEMKF